MEFVLDGSMRQLLSSSGCGSSVISILVYVPYILFRRSPADGHSGPDHSLQMSLA